ncbi:hypothetical protein [Bacteroides sp. 224]|uniref:hypothetical protein n=1 Tax=Bacteroides sp. 224 TaxID=2302936 RepID=UPI0013D7D921|nr:hypothetical protein [Bacteroides sp. 224]NDV64455.1 hypothetical protein [Bacteroides sp. 224]
MIQRYLYNYKVGIAISIAFFYQLICIIQGFDLSDEGWLMYFYQQIFRNPESVEAQMPYWFTGIIGGLWYKLWPEGGFFSMRLLGIMINTFMLYVIYRFLKRFINTPLLLIALLAQVLIVSGDPKPFGYNPLSAFLVIFVIIIFYYGVEKKNVFYFITGGFILGLTFFVRLPNVVYSIFLLLIPFYQSIKEKKLILINKQIISAILGVIIAIFFCLALMKVLGHFEIYVNSISDIINTSSDETNSHKLGTMLSIYIKNYVSILYIASFFLGLGLIYIVLRYYISIKIFSYFLQSLITVFIGYLSIKYNQALRDYDMFFINFISLLGIILLFFNWRKEQVSIKYIGIASLLMVLFTSVGSDHGILTMWTSTWLSLPFAIAYIYKSIQDFKIKFKKIQLIILKKSIIEYSIIIIVVFFITGIYKVDCCAYYDPGCRKEKIFSINNKFCHNIYTNEYRTKLTNELLVGLSLYVKPNDYLLAYDFIPGINYLTETRSYTSNSWIHFYSDNRLHLALEKAVIEKKTLPVIVRHHFLPCNKWSEYDPDYYNENRPESPHFKNKRTQAINRFISSYDYKTAWSNQHFEILIPQNIY